MLTETGVEGPFVDGTTCRDHTARRLMGCRVHAQRIRYQVESYCRSTGGEHERSTRQQKQGGLYQSANRELGSGGAGMLWRNSICAPRLPL